MKLAAFAAVSKASQQKPAVSVSLIVIRAKNQICILSDSDKKGKKMQKKKKQLLAFNTSGAEEHRYSKSIEGKTKLYTKEMIPT